MVLPVLAASMALSFLNAGCIAIGQRPSEIKSSQYETVPPPPPPPGKSPRRWPSSIVREAPSRSSVAETPDAVSRLSSAISRWPRENFSLPL
jgi:hypothetical protein